MGREAVTRTRRSRPSSSPSAGTARRTTPRQAMASMPRVSLSVGRTTEACPRVAREARPTVRIPYGPSSGTCCTNCKPRSGGVLRLVEPETGRSGNLLMRARNAACDRTVRTPVRTPKARIPQPSTYAGRRGCAGSPSRKKRSVRSAPGPPPAAVRSCPVSRGVASGGGMSASNVSWMVERNSRGDRC